MTGRSTSGNGSQEAARLLRDGDYAQAAALFREEIERDERSVDAHRGLATASFLLGEYEAAAEHFQRVCRLDPRCGKSLVNLGAVYNRMGQYGKAVDVLRRASQFEKSAEAFYNLGIAQRQMGQTAMAISAYREAIRRAPEMPEAYLNLANAFLEMGNHQQAIMHYAKALELRPDFEQARTGLEAAQQAVQKSKGEASPFGRLVDAQPRTSAEQAASAAPWNDWTEDELMAHRLKLRHLADGIGQAGHAFTVHLKQRVEPRLAEVTRVVGEGEAGMHALHKARSDFHHALEEWIEMRARLGILMDEVRGED